LGIPDFIVNINRRTLNYDNINVFYAGSFGRYQNPFKHILKLLTLKKITLHFIGNTENEQKLINELLLEANFDFKGQIIFYGLMKKTNTDELIINNADYILVQLDKHFLKYNFPSKIYDALNLSKPILYDLPDGSAKRFITTHKIGIDLTLNSSNLSKQLFDQVKYSNLQENIISIRENYKMSDKVKSLID
jgi:hypothetical protein